MDWMESLVERRIREAMARGEFDDLPGAGRPLDLRDTGDPDWWIKRYLRAEDIDLSLALPTPLALRREAEGFPESLSALADEDEVRSTLVDFNARVEADWRRPVRGRGLPVQAYQVDVEDMVRRWREARADTAQAGGDGSETRAPRPHADVGRRERWRERWRRRPHP